MRNFQRIGPLLLVVFTGYLLQLVDGANLIINPSGQNQSQPAGKGFVLMCQGEAENPDLFSDLKWHGPSGELTWRLASPIEVSNMGNKLVLMFKNPTTEDSGTYSCSAMYDSTERLNTSVNLVFYQDITWEDCPEEQALVVSSDGKVRCRVSANPPATITWSKDGRPLEKSDERYITETDGILVTSVTEEDKGEFVVKAMVPQTGNFQSRFIKVEVHVPPEIIELDDKAEVVEGNEALLQCQATGFPRPLYSWFDPAERDLSMVEGHVVDADTGTLRFLSVKREEQGHYTCMAKNPAGEAKRGLDLSVIVKPEIQQFNNVTSVESNTTTFECHAYGDPLPEITIRKDGSDRAFPNEDDRITVNQRKEADKAILTLTIRNTIRSDDGLYYCAAENKGAHVEKVGHLTVEFAPVMSSTPETSAKTWNGNSKNLTCIAESIPNATITWSYVGQPIQDSEVYTIYGRAGISKLQVRPPADFNRDGTTVYGTYKCSATNPYGSQFINIELLEARTPGKLLQTTVEKKTATTITFKFHGPRDDGGLPVRAFAVTYYDENEGLDKSQTHEWSEGSSYILENLKPETAYRFTFAARNDVGVGEWSEQIRVVMPEVSAPEPPRFITPGGNVSTYPDRFQIRWTVPLDNGRKIEYFELRYFEVEEHHGVWRSVGEPVIKKITKWEYAPMYEMKNLKPNTYYKVEVRASNEIGFSLDATMVFQTAADPSKRSQGLSPVHLPGSGHEGLRDDYHGGSSGSLTTGAIAAIIFVLLLVVLIAVDVLCYVRYKWGVFYLIRNRACAKPIVNNKAKEAAVEDGKGGGNEPTTNNGNIKVDSTIAVANNEKGDNLEKKSKTEVDNPAFDKEKEHLQSKEQTEKDNEGDVATEETPMIQSPGAKDTKPNDGTNEDLKNKSPKGSKSSIAKDSLV